MNSDNEYFGTAKKTIATLSSQGTTDANTIDISTNASSNFIWLTAPSSTFYYYEDTAWCSRKNKDMGTISKGDGNTTRSLQALRTNQSFNSGDHYGSGDARHIVSFSVSLDDRVDP